MGLCACVIRITSREGGAIFYVDASLICIKDLNISAFAFPGRGGSRATPPPPRPGSTVMDYTASGSTRGSAFCFCYVFLSYEIQCNLSCVMIFGYLFLSALSSYCLSSFVAPTNPQTLQGST